MAASPTFVYILRPRRATFPDAITPDERRVLAEHHSYLARLLSAGDLILNGRARDGSFGLVMFTANDDAAALRVMESDPAVTGGVMAAELTPFTLAHAAQTIPI